MLVASKMVKPSAVSSTGNLPVKDLLKSESEGLAASLLPSFFDLAFLSAGSTETSISVYSKPRSLPVTFTSPDY